MLSGAQGPQCNNHSTYTSVSSDLVCSVALTVVGAMEQSTAAHS